MPPQRQLCQSVQPDLEQDALPLSGQRSIRRWGSGRFRGEDANGRGCSDDREPDREDAGAPGILGGLFDDWCQRLACVDLDERRRRDDRTAVRAQQLGDVAAWFQTAERERPKLVAQDDSTIRPRRASRRRIQHWAAPRLSGSPPSLNERPRALPGRRHALTYREYEENDGAITASARICGVPPRRGSSFYEMHTFQRAHRHRCSLTYGVRGRGHGRCIPRRNRNAQSQPVPACQRRGGDD